MQPEPPPLRRVALTVAYEGTEFLGFQAQREGRTVAGVLEAAARTLGSPAPDLKCAGRTDTGVHALGLVAHFEVPRAELKWPPRKLVLALNAHLPADIRVLAASRARPDFHARFDATGKQYRYFVWNHPAMNPLLRHQAWHVPRKLDLAAMRVAARAFCGRHDFRAFTANPGYPRASTVRTLRRCEIHRRGPLLTFVLEGEMCRGIVGTLVQVGLGKFPPAAMSAMLAGGDRRLTGMTAPAHGLVLWKVFYSGKPARPAATSRAAAEPAEREG